MVKIMTAEDDSPPRPARRRQDGEPGQLENSGRSPRKSAREKAMDLLARRSHSELELRQKLEISYPPAAVDEALAYVRENNWLPRPEDLSERLASELGRKKKGHRYINQFLRQKGLPPVSKSLDDEVEKAAAVVQAKLAKSGPFDYEERKKVYRLLSNRGFDEETIRRVLNRSEAPSNAE